MSTPTVDAVFFSPHPDDVEIFAGGTVARLTSLGHRVAIVDLTRGEMGTNGTPETRRQESLAAAEILGVATRPCLDLGDGRLDDGDPEQVRAVVEAIREYRPRLVFGPADRDRHPDHEATHRLVRRANFQAGLANAAADGRPHRADRICWYLCHLMRTPSFLVDVSDHIDERRRAIAAYGSQFQRGAQDRETPINRPGFLPGLESRLAAFGQDAGIAFAEPFLMDGPPLISDPLTHLERGHHGT